MTRCERDEDDAPVSIMEHIPCKVRQIAVVSGAVHFVGKPPDAHSNMGFAVQEVPAPIPAAEGEDIAALIIDSNVVEERANQPTQPIESGLFPLLEVLYGTRLRVFWLR